MPSPPELTLTFSGAYSLDRLERTIATLEPAFKIDEPTVVTVDLYRLVHLSPTSLALITAAIRRLIDARLTATGSHIIDPKSKSVNRYLQRMNLFRELVPPDQAKEDFTRRPAEGFRPCQHFTNDVEYVEVARSLTDALCEASVIGKKERGSIRVALDEVCENVIHHAATPLGGFAAAQGWPDGKRRQFEIGIVDLGVGVRASLTKNPTYARIDDDVDAIVKALEPRVTSTPERNAGIGLFITSLLLVLNQGKLLVRSGHGAVERSSKPSASSRPAYLPGTVVALKANMDQPLSIDRVYKALTKIETRMAQEETAHADERSDAPPPR